MMLASYWLLCVTGSMLFYMADAQALSCTNSAPMFSNDFKSNGSLDNDLRVDNCNNSFEYTDTDSVFPFYLLSLSKEWNCGNIQSDSERNEKLHSFWLPDVTDLEFREPYALTSMLSMIYPEYRKPFHFGSMRDNETFPWRDLERNRDDFNSECSETFKHLYTHSNPGHSHFFNVARCRGALRRNYKHLSWWEIRFWPWTTKNRESEYLTGALTIQYHKMRGRESPSSLIVGAIFVLRQFRTVQEHELEMVSGSIHRKVNCRRLRAIVFFVPNNCSSGSTRQLLRDSTTNFSNSNKIGGLSLAYLLSSHPGPRPWSRAEHS